MSNPGDADATPITSLKQLADYLAAGCKPAEQFRLGTEHEKFGFRHADLSTPPYEPAGGQPGSIRGLLEALHGFGGTPILDRGAIIGLKQGDAAISLEPAGQLELSGGATGNTAPDQGGAGSPLRPGARRVGRTGDRVPAARFPSLRKTRGHAVDAQGALRDHAALHARGRYAWPGHDDAHLHGAGEPGLRVRTGHGAQAAWCRCWLRSRWRRRCSPTRPSLRGGRTVSSPTGRISGPTWTTSGPASLG